MKATEAVKGMNAMDTKKSREATILPSLLSANFYDLSSSLHEIEEAGIQHLHLDVMDGHFVPNISFGPGLIQSLRPHTDLFFDTHLMVEEPSFLFDSFADAGCDLLTIHWEAVTHVHRAIQEIHDRNMKAGIALNPATPSCVLDAILPDVDLILVMTVNPGFGGQSYITSMTQKIQEVREKIDAIDKDIILEVDGGVKLSNIREALEAGCDWAVVGSAIFGAEDVTKEALKFQQIAKDASDSMMERK